MTVCYIVTPLTGTHTNLFHKNRIYIALLCQNDAAFSRVFLCMYWETLRVMLNEAWDEIKKTKDTEAGALACTIKLCEGERCTCPAVSQSPHCSSSLTCPWVKGPRDRPDLPWIPVPRLGWPFLSSPVTSPIIPEQHLRANAFVFTAPWSRSILLLHFYFDLMNYTAGNISIYGDILQTTLWKHLTFHPIFEKKKEFFFCFALSL